MMSTIARILNLKSWHKKHLSNQEVQKMTLTTSIVMAMA